jgi:LPXTG-site transpeptidase (sortase) family protein
MNPSDNTIQPMQPSQSYQFGRARLPRRDEDADQSITPVPPGNRQPNHVEPMQAANDTALADALEAARRRIEELHAHPEPETHTPGTVVAPTATGIAPAQTATVAADQVAHPFEAIQPAAVTVPAVQPFTPAAQPAPAETLRAPIEHLPFSDPLRTASSATNPSMTHSPAKPKPQAKKKTIPTRLKPILTAVGTMALILVVFKAQILLSQIGYLTGSKTGASAVTTSASAIPAASTMSIPKINVNAPVVYEPSIVEANVQKSLENGIVHYGNTAVPGQAGNSVFVGHSSNDWWEPGNYKFVFVLLDKLVVGDTFSINYQSTKYVYQVTEVKVVEPTDLSVLAQTNDPTVTLITCTPPGTSWKRLVIKAKQISPTGNVKPASATQSASATPALPGSSTGFVDQIKSAWHGFVSIFSSHDSTTDTPASPTVPSASTLPNAS